jgi:hypothetical protein
MFPPGRPSSDGGASSAAATSASIRDPVDRVLSEGKVSGVDEQHARPRVAQLVGDLVGREMPVERRDPHPGGQRAEAQLDQLDPVARELRHVAVGWDVEVVTQEVGGPAHAVGQIRPGARAREVVERDRIRRTRRRVEQPGLLAQRGPRMRRPGRAPVSSPCSSVTSPALTVAT